MVNYIGTFLNTSSLFILMARFMCKLGAGMFARVKSSIAKG